MTHGSLARIRLSEIPGNLTAWTGQAATMNAAQGNVDQSFPLYPARTRSKHVIYIIKENRTYDQIFGDLGAGDGDAFPGDVWRRDYA